MRKMHSQKIPRRKRRAKSKEKLKKVKTLQI